MRQAINGSPALPARHQASAKIAKIAQITAQASAQVSQQVSSAISSAETIITRQRAELRDRTALGKPVEALRPVLKEIEGNLSLLNKLQKFCDARARALRG